MTKKVLNVTLILIIAITILSVLNRFNVSLPLNLDKLNISMLKITSLLVFCFVYSKNENEVAKYGIILVFVSFFISTITLGYQQSNFFKFFNNTNRVIYELINLLYFLSLYSLLNTNDKKIEYLKNGTIIMYIIHIIMLIIIFLIKTSINYDNFYYSVLSIESLLKYSVFILFLLAYKNNLNNIINSNSISSNYNQQFSNNIQNTNTNINNFNSNNNNNLVYGNNSTINNNNNNINQNNKGM